MRDATTLASVNSNWTGPTSAVTSLWHSGKTKDITSLDYFDVGWRGTVPTLPDKELDRLSVFNYTSTFLDNIPLSELASVEKYPDIWIPSDTMAKSFESMILTDLGQASAQPNILADPDLLQHFTANFSQIMELARENGIPLISVNDPNHPLAVGPVTKDYNTLKDTTGTLGVKNSTMAANYLCSVPKQKPTGDLLVSLTVADLVFLQAVWFVFTLVVCLILKQRDDTADYCVGCIQRGAGLVHTTSKSGTSYELLNTPQRESDGLSLRSTVHGSAAVPEGREEGGVFHDARGSWGRVSLRSFS